MSNVQNCNLHVRNKIISLQWQWNSPDICLELSHLLHQCIPKFQWWESKRNEVQNKLHVLKVVLWRKLQLSYQGCFKTQPSSLYQKKKCCLLFSNIAFRSEILKFSKILWELYGKWYCYKLNWILIKHLNKNITATLTQKCMVLGSKILLEVHVVHIWT